MDLGKLKLRAKFEVAGFSYYGNISEFVFRRQNSLFEPPFGGVMDIVRILSIARWKARSRLPIRDN